MLNYLPLVQSFGKTFDGLDVKRFNVILKQKIRLMGNLILLQIDGSDFYNCFMFGCCRFDDLQLSN
ncbi:MAG: hypothetical protein LBC20_14305 [Planctomycetaceae bacterium]|jgi:hypothetical protein|nr:hypothetical protein [Planctomycetaceae bacterium]